MAQEGIVMEDTFYKDVLLALTDGVYAVDTKQKILFWNKAAEKFTGYKAAEVIGRSCAENLLCHVSPEGKELCAKGCPLKSTLEKGTFEETAVFLHHKNGHCVPITLKTSPLINKTGNLIGAVEVFSLASSQESVLEKFEKLREDAFQDRLTGIGNRRFGEATLENMFFLSAKNNSTYGLLFVDVDHFKDINDTWGHPVGDKVLRMIAQSLTSELREFDAVCRWGGEEFLLIFSNSNIQELSSIGERLRKLIEEIQLDLDGLSIKVTASFGGVIARKNEDIPSILLRADKQVYLSKRNGRNMVSIDR